MKIFRALLLITITTLLPAAAAADLTFAPDPDGGFRFDTGDLRGRLRLAGKSLGLQEVTNAATGLRLDRSNGLLSHYRVFTRGRRYGGGAWDWPSQARVLPASSPAPGGVEVAWAADAERPFELRAVYRILDARTIELTTTVRPTGDLAGFESFVASYFAEPFTNAWVGVTEPASPGAGRWLPADLAHGEWQMFPRSAAAVPLIEDGRWSLEPNPVRWTLRDPVGESLLVLRRAPTAGLRGILVAEPEACFALALPHETEGHRSVYFSLFGRDIKTDETVSGRIRLTIGTTDDEAWTRYRAARRAWTGSRAR